MRAELTKLRRPASYLILMFTILVGVGTVGLAQAADADQWAVVSEGLAELDTAAGVDRLCEALQVTGEECAARVSEQRANIESLGLDLVRDQPYAAALQTSTAAPGVAAGLMASWLGIISVAMIASAHITSEWQNGTARVLLSGRESPFGFLMTKMMTVFVAALLLLAGLALTLAAISPLLRALYPVAPLDPAFDVGNFSGTRSASTLAVLAFVSCLTTAVAMIVRHSLAVIGVTVALNLGATYMATWGSLVNWTPTFWVASAMGFDASGRLRDHVWPTTFPIGGDEPLAYQPVAGFLGMFILATTALAVAYFWLQRAEVR